MTTVPQEPLAESAINIEPLAALMEAEAAKLEECARTLRYRALATRERGKDIACATDAMIDIKNCIANIRLDLFVSRTIRAMEQKL